MLHNAQTLTVIKDHGFNIMGRIEPWLSAKHREHGPTGHCQIKRNWPNVDDRPAG